MTAPIDLSHFDEVKSAPVDLSRYDEVAPIGKLDSLAAGAKQGLTMGFSDELSGLLQHLIAGKDYSAARDSARAIDRAAKEANTGTYLAGEIGAGAATALVPVGGIVKGAGVAANIARGAGAGILQGIGTSEADLAQGDIAGVAKDAAIGGLAGGAVGGVVGTVANKVIGGAARRAENAEVAGLKEGVQYSTKLKTFGKATPAAPEGEFTAPIKAALKAEPEIGKAIRAEPGRALQMVDQKVDGLADTLDHIYTQAQAGGPAATAAAVKALGKVEDKFGGTIATEGLAETVKGVATRLEEKYPTGIPVEALRKEYRAWQDVANKSMKLFSAKSPKEEVSEEMANALRSVLQEHVDQVATSQPALGISRKALEATNKEISTWIRVQKALTEKASRENIGAPPMGGVVKGLTSLLHPVRAIGNATEAAGRPIDAALVKLIAAAKNGDVAAAMTLRALGKGVPRGLSANATDIPGGALSAALSPISPDDQPY